MKQVYTYTPFRALLLSLFMGVALNAQLMAAGCPTLTTTVVRIACYGQTGSITASATGGVAPYSYSLNNGPYGAAATFNNVAAGTYTVSVKDHSNCVTSTTVVMSQPQPVGATTSQTNIACFGTATGAIFARGSGEEQYKYSINNGPYGLNGSFGNLVAGKYTIVVMDVNGCTQSVTVTLTQPAHALTLTTTATNVTCPGTSNGSITATAANGTAPYTYSLNGGAYQSSNTFTGLGTGNDTVTAMDNNGCTATSPVTITTGAATACSLGYPDSSNLPRSLVAFNESEVLRATDPVGSTCVSSATSVKVWYNDEHAMTLGVRSVVVKTAAGTTTTNYSITPTPSSPTCVSYPLVGSTIGYGAQSGNDVAAGGGRPLWPALFITDVTVDPNNRSGDWQQGGTGVAPSQVCGMWKGAVKTVDSTKNPVLITVTPDADPVTKNNWTLGGGDVPPGGFTSLTNEGYGAEAEWNISDLGLVAGHTYHLQFMVHDGDQNKAGGDVGESCATIYVPQISGKPVVHNATGIVETGNTENALEVSMYPNPFNSTVHVKIESNGADPIELKMFDLTGRLVIEKKNIETNFDLTLSNEIGTGIYFVQVKQGDYQKVLRMVKEN